MTGILIRTVLIWGSLIIGVPALVNAGAPERPGHLPPKSPEWVMAGVDTAGKVGLQANIDRRRQHGVR